MPGMLRKSTTFVPRYQKFESISLQQRVERTFGPWVRRLDQAKGRELGIGAAPTEGRRCSCSEDGRRRRRRRAGTARRQEGDRAWLRRTKPSHFYPLIKGSATEAGPGARRRDSPALGRLPHNTLAGQSGASRLPRLRSAISTRPGTAEAADIKLAPSGSRAIADVRDKRRPEPSGPYSATRQVRSDGPR